MTVAPRSTRVAASRQPRYLTSLSGLRPEALRPRLAAGLPLTKRFHPECYKSTTCRSLHTCLKTATARSRLAAQARALFEPKHSLYKGMDDLMSDSQGFLSHGCRGL